jgi:hypothetical protein
MADAATTNTKNLFIAISYSGFRNGLSRSLEVHEGLEAFLIKDLCVLRTFEPS